MINITEIKKRQEALPFDQILDIKEQLLERDPSILDIKDVQVKGQIQYDQGLYLLNYQLTYVLTLPSSRSMQAVELNEEQAIEEIFIEKNDLQAKADLVEDNLVLILEEDAISLEESAIDNILLAIPLQVLTPEELASDDLPSGNDWEVLTEEQYQALKAEAKKENNPFASLDGLFNE